MPTTRPDRDHRVLVCPAIAWADDEIIRLRAFNAELMEAYETYIKLLEIEVNHLTCFAYVHDYRCRPAVVKQGEKARAALAKAKGEQ